MAARGDPWAEDLFGQLSEPGPEPLAGPRPLAGRLRPQSLEEVVGQDHLLGPDGTLTRMLARGSLASLILWGPPGCGKTTIARLLAARSGLHFMQLSAVFSGVADLKRAFDEAARRQGTLLFVDEIHRFNRAQQDGFLPVVETGTITLIGATTENPSFALNGTLLSGCQVLVLRRLDDEALEHLLSRAEQIFALPDDMTPMDPTELAALLACRAALYDKDREEHYNLIAARHKSLRGSDPDAALYCFARMSTGDDDPRYIARRLAAEDIGMADPNAQSLAGWETYERLGSPEGELAIAPESNAIYKAFGAARPRLRTRDQQASRLLVEATRQPAQTCLMDSEVFSFGSFRLIPSQRVLLADGKPIRLGSRAFDLLTALVERSGELIPHDELMARAWPDTVVEEGSLRVHLAALRKVLGGGAGDTFIINIPGRGYQFVAPVQRSQKPDPIVRSPVATLGNLPAPLPRIIGRDDAIGTATRQLAQHRCLTIVGPGGIGKTTVATAVASAAAVSYPDGVWFVCFASLPEPGLVPSAIAAALGIPLPAENAVFGLTTWLRDKTALILLDSCEHVIAAAASACFGRYAATFQ
jgi:putative ATPase